MDKTVEKLTELIREAKKQYILYRRHTDFEEVIDMPTEEEYIAMCLEKEVILPPCKVGDTVYDICTIFDKSTLKSKTIIKPRIIDFVSSVAFLIESKGLVLSEKDFGRTVFLTKEEAEEHLQKGTN